MCWWLCYFQHTVHYKNTTN